ncbi:MAG: type II and III secretion system protein, partial [Bdellovibrionales bacterium]|nr:type II and III secretion system protein [Bdellovibrionales bacterium]
TLSSVENSSAVIKNNDPSAPNFAVQLGLGKIDGSVLSARLAMAESEGVAKILSSPKIVTINNVGATINSGITYTVKTLASSGSTDRSASVSGGITQVSAGLTLSVRPTIVGTDQIKLNINVTNSEPDNSTLVDGIPGIVNNSTNTEIIVKSGNTASVAGLIKHNNSQSEGGVPYLSKIPLFGWLFKSQTTDSRDKELMIFITPKIIRRDLAGDYMSHSQEMKKHLVPENKDREEEEATSERKDQAKTEGTTRK